MTRTHGPEHTNVVDFAEWERALTGILLLEFAPVAVTTVHTAEEFEAFGADRPEAPVHYCEAVRRAAHGEVLKLAAEDMSCDTSPRFLGLAGGHDDDDFIESYAETGLYRDHETTRRMLADAAVLPPLSGLAVVPLRCQPADREPDVVVVMTDPHGAMRLSQAAGFVGHTMGQHAIGMHGMCVESTAAPIVSGRMHVSMLCSGARHTGAWPDHVLSVGIPGCLMADILTGLRLTADRFEPDCRKHRISQAGADVPDLVPGNAYFLG